MRFTSRSWAATGGLCAALALGPLTVVAPQSAIASVAPSGEAPVAGQSSSTRSGSAAKKPGISLRDVSVSRGWRQVGAEIRWNRHLAADLHGKARFTVRLVAFNDDPDDFSRVLYEQSRRHRPTGWKQSPTISLGAGKARIASRAVDVVLSFSQQHARKGARLFTRADVVTTHLLTYEGRSGRPTDRALRTGFGVAYVAASSSEVIVKHGGVAMQRLSDGPRVLSPGGGQTVAAPAKEASVKALEAPVQRLATDLKTALNESTGNPAAQKLSARVTEHVDTTAAALDEAATLASEATSTSLTDQQRATVTDAFGKSVGRAKVEVQKAAEAACGSGGNASAPERCELRKIDRVVDKLSAEDLSTPTLADDASAAVARVHKDVVDVLEGLDVLQESLADSLDSMSALRGEARDVKESLADALAEKKSVAHHDPATVVELRDLQDAGIASLDQLDDIPTAARDVLAGGALDPAREAFAKSEEAAAGAAGEGVALLIAAFSEGGGDLAAADLSRQDLSDTDFSDANFAGVQLSDAKLTNMTAKGAYVEGVDVRGAVDAGPALVGAIGTPAGTSPPSPAPAPAPEPPAPAPAPAPEPPAPQPDPVTPVPAPQPDPVTPNPPPAPGPTLFTLTYDGNGSTGGAAPTDGSSPYAAGAVVTVLDNSGLLIRDGFIFAGWNTAADGSGVPFLPGMAFPMPDSAVTLYAMWVPTFVVTYDANGSTGGTVPVDASSPYPPGAGVTVLGNSGSLVRAGFTFGGWNTAPDGSGVGYPPGVVLPMPDSAVTLYAWWL